MLENVYVFCATAIVQLCVCVHVCLCARAFSHSTRLLTLLRAGGRLKNGFAIRSLWSRFHCLEINLRAHLLDCFARCCWIFLIGPPRFLKYFWHWQFHDPVKVHWGTFQEKLLGWKGPSQRSSCLPPLRLVKYCWNPIRDGPSPTSHPSVWNTAGNLG